MKKNPLSMYLILALALMITLGFSYDWFRHERVSIKEQCTLSAAYETWDIQGTKTQIRKITITWQLPLTSVSKDPEQIAFDRLGRNLALLETSDALELNYRTNEKDDENTLILCLTVRCERLAPEDYEYLNANDLSLLGTIDYSSATCEDLAVVLKTRGYSCVSPK